MEEIYAACIGYEPYLLDYVEFKRITEPIWILGRGYNIHSGDDFEKLNEEIRSILWFTYRKQFLPIGGSGLTSDSGWGCMHRCGQMIMAQAMIWRHLGRDWKWKPDCDNETYQKILLKFADQIESQYSIHKIALNGCIFEKKVGQWFGPNTIVHILKMLSEKDPEKDISVHVAMDQMVIKSEIRKLFRSESKCLSDLTAKLSSIQTSASSISSHESDTCTQETSSTEEVSYPVLLAIPLRLGLSQINSMYFDKLKAAFTMKQSLGIIGGRTNHASYFIGYAGNELIYLDPHTTQLYKSDAIDDSSYHCQNPSRMSFTQLNPSIGLIFYLEDEADFNQWCTEAQKVLLESGMDAIFEILEEKPEMLPYLDSECDDDFCNTSLNNKDRIYTSDDEFELL